jgi:hypothetical protein
VGENIGAENANQEPDQWAEDCVPERNPPFQYYFALFHDNDLLGTFVVWAVFPDRPISASWKGVRLIDESTKEVDDHCHYQNG